MKPERAVLAALTVTMLVVPLARRAPAQDQGGVAVLHLADGSELPLTSWALSYEYQAWKEGTSQAFSQTAKRSVRELWSGKKVLPVAGAVLEIQYKLYDRQIDVDGQPTKAQGATVTGFVLSAGGKKNELKSEPPNKDLLLPAGASKGLVVQARALDLHGETLTGTKRDYCLVSYTPQVECSAAAAERVVRIEFPK
jgi:hypothetical protein